MNSKSGSVFFFFLVLFFLCLGITLLFFYDSQKQVHNLLSPSPTIALTSPTPINNAILFPVGGETLLKGNSYTLKWQGGDKTVAILLVIAGTGSSGSSSITVDKVLNITNTGSYQYTIPQSIKTGNYQFEIGNMKSNIFVVASNQATALPCVIQDLASKFSPDVAAGNVYGTLSITNISKNSCLLNGSNYPTITYSSFISNLKIVHSEKISTQSYLLSPQQSVYALAHYPNGPQCQSEIKQIPVTFIYQLNQAGILYFHDFNGRETVLLTGCVAQSDITQVDLSPFSSVKPGA